MKNRKMRALALALPARSARYPDGPTMAEAGYPNVELLAWFGIFAPTGTPPMIVRRLNAEFIQSIRAPDVAKRFTDLGLDLFATSPEDFAAHLAKFAAMREAADIASKSRSRSAAGLLGAVSRLMSIACALHHVFFGDPPDPRLHGVLGGACAAS